MWSSVYLVHTTVHATVPEAQCPWQDTTEKLLLAKTGSVHLRFAKELLDATQ